MDWQGLDLDAEVPDALTTETIEIVDSSPAVVVEAAEPVEPYKVPYEALYEVVSGSDRVPEEPSHDLQQELEQTLLEAKELQYPEK